MSSPTLLKDRAMSIERAIEIAARAHAGQVDKAEEPYIFHPLRVMLSLSGVQAQMAAVLHDVVEDTGITLDDLKSEGFSGDVVEAVAALTKADGESRLDAARRASQHPIARQVKLADVEDNINLSRLRRQEAHGEPPLPRRHLRHPANRVSVGWFQPSGAVGSVVTSASRSSGASLPPRM